MYNYCNEYTSLPVISNTPIHTHVLILHYDHGRQANDLFQFTWKSWMKTINYIHTHVSIL